MRKFNRSGYCTEFSIKNLKETVTVYGWVQKKRELGRLVFIDLRDRSGIIQLALDDSADEKLFEIIHKELKVVSDYFRQVNLETGEIEVKFGKLVEQLIL